MDVHAMSDDFQPAPNPSIAAGAGSAARRAARMCW